MVVSMIEPLLETMQGKWLLSLESDEGVEKTDMISFLESYKSRARMQCHWLDVH